MTMIERFRARRAAARRTRAIERVLQATNSSAVRDEILAIAQRYDR